MPELLEYSEAVFPSDLRWQAVSFMRIEWPFIDGGLLRSPYPSSFQPQHFAMVEGDILLSYAAVLCVDVAHDGRSFAMAGLGNLLTYPSHRRLGLGTRVVEAATRFIDNSAVDIAALFCDPILAGFYARCGWRRTEGAPTLIGADGTAHRHEALRMMRFVSGRGKAAEDAFHTQPLYLPFEW